MSVPAEQLNNAASQQPSVTADEQQLSQFDDIPDDVIDGMSGGSEVDDEQVDGSGASQPNAGFSAHEDEPSQPQQTDTPEGEQQPTGETTQVDEPGEQQQTQDQVQQPETEEQRQAREAEVAQKRQEYIGELTKKYALSDEDAEKALLKPEEVLPNLAANLHANVVQEVLGLMQAHLPVMIQSVGQTSTRETEARNAFYSANQDLNKPEYEKAVLTAGKMYREMNPGAKPEEAIKAIGRLARAAVGLPEPTGEAATPQKPFRPARPGGSGTPPAPRPAPRKTEGEPDWGELSKDD